MLAIIADNEPSEDIHNFLMIDDGIGYSVKIPTFMISFYDGDKIKSAVKSDIVAEINSEIVAENPEDFTDEERDEYAIDQVDTSNMTYDEVEWTSGQKVVIKASIELAPKTDGTIYVDLWYTNIYNLFLSSTWMDIDVIATMQDIFGDKIIF